MRLDNDGLVRAISSVSRKCLEQFDVSLSLFLTSNLLDTYLVTSL